MATSGSPELIVGKTLAELEKAKRQILASQPHDFFKLHGKSHVMHLEQVSLFLFVYFNETCHPDPGFVCKRMTPRRVLGSN